MTGPPFHTVLWIDGNPPISATTDDLSAAELTIAADGGLNHAIAAGQVVDVLVGDLDSVAPDVLKSFAGEIVKHPVDKDFTDLELALDIAIESGATEITVIGGGGGRIDHELAGLLVLTQQRYARCDIRARNGAALVSVLRPSSSTILSGEPGEVVSIIPVGGRIEGVTTVGLRWELNAECLEFGATRGVSNELIAGSAEVVIEVGVALVVQPQRFSVGG